MLGQVLSAVTVVPAAANASPRGCRTNPGANDPRCPPGQRIHHGADISAPQGSPIYAPVAGVVQKVWPNGALSRYGNLLLLYVPEDNKTLVFAHMMDPPARADGTPLREGEAVQAGQQVGKVGYTGACRGARSAHGVPCTPCGPGGRYLCGGAGGAHLHFEVRPGRVNRPNPRGASLDPHTYARSRGFTLSRGGGLSGLGQAVYTSDPAMCDGIKYYCDPHGFELGDDEAPPSTRTVLWAGVAIGAGLLVYLMVR